VAVAVNVGENVAVGDPVGVTVTVAVQVVVGEKVGVAPWAVPRQAKTPVAVKKLRTKIFVSLINMIGHPLCKSVSEALIRVLVAWAGHRPPLGRTANILPAFFSNPKNQTGRALPARASGDR
jgi:hypothetical protein